MKKPDIALLTLRELLDRLAHMLPPGWMWRQDQPVRIPDYDEPEPEKVTRRACNF